MILRTLLLKQKKSKKKITKPSQPNQDRVWLVQHNPFGLRVHVSRCLIHARTFYEAMGRVELMRTPQNDWLIGRRPGLVPATDRALCVAAGTTFACSRTEFVARAARRCPGGCWLAGTARKILLFVVATGVACLTRLHCFNGGIYLIPSETICLLCEQDQGLSVWREHKKMW